MRGEAVQTLRSPPFAGARGRGEGPSDGEEDATSGEEEQEEEGGTDGPHYAYDRALAHSSHSVSCLAFAGAGRWLVAGTVAGDLKVFDARCWAEVAALRVGRARRHGEPGEAVRAVAAAPSPSQAWLVSVQPSALHVFRACAPWGLEDVLPASAGTASAGASEVFGPSPEWCCVAFAPAEEAAAWRPAAAARTAARGAGGCELVALSTTQLCVLNFRDGWGQQASRRCHSLPRSARATVVAYTPCGGWIVWGNERGHVQVWSAMSLELERTLLPHTGKVQCLTCSPTTAPYAPLCVSCGADSTLQLLRPGEWHVEQIVTDRRCGKAGIRLCAFSPSGTQLLSFGKELLIWRVACARRGDAATPVRGPVLRLLQRLDAACNVKGLRAAAFCASNAALVAGSCDGALALWADERGEEEEDGQEEEEEEEPSAKDASPSASRSPSPFRAASPGPDAGAGAGGPRGGPPPCSPRRLPPHLPPWFLRVRPRAGSCHEAFASPAGPVLRRSCSAPGEPARCPPRGRSAPLPRWSAGPLRCSGAPRSDPRSGAAAEPFETPWGCSALGALAAEKLGAVGRRRSCPALPPTARWRPVARPAERSPPERRPAERRPAARAAPGLAA